MDIDLRIQWYEGDTAFIPPPRIVIYITSAREYGKVCLGEYLLLGDKRERILCESNFGGISKLEKHSLI